MRESEGPRAAVLVQEDAHSAVLDVDSTSRTGFFAVFDGHGGKEVAKFCASHLVGDVLCVSAAQVSLPALCCLGLCKAECNSNPQWAG